MFSSDRVFRFWEYLVSHDHLLIRSPMNPSVKGSTNIDLVFSGVEYIESVTMFRGLKIESPTEEDVNHLATIFAKSTDGQKCFVLVSGSNRSYIVANGLDIEENSSPFLEPRLRHIISEE